MFLKPSKKSGDNNSSDPYDSRFYRSYSKLLATCIRFRWITLLIVGGFFAVSVWGFGYVKSSFFPPSTRPQIMVDLWMPQGTHIDRTTEKAIQLEELLMGEDSVTNVTTIVGRGALRFLLTYGPEKANSAYAHFLVDVEEAKSMDALISKIDNEFKEAFPAAQLYGYKFELGPGSKGKIEPRFYGKNPDILRELEQKGLAILRNEPDAKAITTNWRQRVKILRPQVLEEQASLLGITKPDIANTIKQGFSGLTVGIYREEDLILPIILKAGEDQNANVANLNNLQIFSPTAQRNISLSQIVTGFTTEFEDEIIYRRDRRRALSIFADPSTGTSSELLEAIRPKFEAIDLPAGYSLEWGGEFEDSGRAKASLAGSIPTFIGMMILMTILLFNSLRQPLVIWLCVPLILIGVAAGLLLFDQPFNFMAILGFLSLVGMMIKNAIVLIDEINEQNRMGQSPFKAILDSGTSRLRPVAMAAATTALGMIPLFVDAFFVAMAITIIFGLVVGSVLTMVVLPVIYAVVFRVPNE